MSDDIESVAKNLAPWDPKEALRTLASESALSEDEDEIAISERLLKENAPQATLSLVHLSQNSPNDSIRMKASQYILDRVLGRADELGLQKSSDPFMEFLSDCVKDYS